MSLYYVLTIDGDWDEYFQPAAPSEERQPDKKILMRLLCRQLSATRPAGGKLLHFIHTSETTRHFFLLPKFLAVWRRIQAGGGSVGVHYHHETYGPKGLSDPLNVMTPGIGVMLDTLRRRHLKVISYRGGYLAFLPEQIPLLETYGFLLDFSCDPGRYNFHDGKVAADWRDAPNFPYRLSYEDHRKPGRSKLTEIPMGKVGKDALYLDTTPLWIVWKTARALARQSRKENKNLVVSILTHTFEFSSWLKWLKILLALWICRFYGTYINDREAFEITRRELGELPKEGAA